jgi:hypothetical protein
MEIQDKPLTNNTLVDFDLGNNLRGTGRVVGIMLMPLPVLGRLYAVEVLDWIGSEIDKEVYDYPVVGVHEVWITKIHSKKFGE